MQVSITLDHDDDYGWRPILTIDGQRAYTGEYRATGMEAARKALEVLAKRLPMPAEAV
jgi:hypothetical protein